MSGMRRRASPGAAACSVLHWEARSGTDGSFDFSGTGLGLPPPARDQPAGHLGDRRQPELHRRPRGERVRPPGRAAGRPLYRTRRL